VCPAGRSERSPVLRRSIERPALRVALLTPLLALVATGCSSTSAPSVPPAAPSSITPVKTGGTLTYAAAGSLVSFNVNTREGATFTDQQVMDRVWPQTFLVDPGFKPELDPAFVQSAELTSTDPQTIVYKINPRAVWSDGVPISADDFVYNWRAQSGTGLDVDGQPYDVASTAGYSDIKSISASADGKTVTVVFKNPFADWESLFHNLVPAHVAERVGWNTGFDSFDPSVVISGGPFMVTSYTPGSDLVLTRNPHYWGTPAKLDHIVFRFVRGGDESPAALGAGQVDLLYPKPQAHTLSEVKHMPGVTHHSGLGLSHEDLVFNEASWPVSDVAVRRAISLSIDRRKLAKETVDKVVSYIGPDDNHLFVNAQDGYQDNATGYERADLPMARRVLEADGYHLGPDRTFSKGERSLDVTLLCDASSPLATQTAGIIQSDLRAAGFGVSVSKVSPSDLAARLEGHSYELALHSAPGTPFLSDLAPEFQTASDSTGGQNWTGFSDQRVDRLFDEAASQLYQPQAFATYNQIDRILWSDMVSLPLYEDPSLVAYSSSYANISVNGSEDGPFWDAEVWGLKLAPRP
jgi:peptide/nickel transport system substrate-binding protein